MLDVNLIGAFLGIKTVVPSMRKAGGGSIINISSNGGHRRACRTWRAYSASKWAVRGLSQIGRHRARPHGIRVNTVHPGGIDTPMTRFEGDAATTTAPFYKYLPIKRIGTVDDVAPVVLFLASDEAGYVTGAEYVRRRRATAGDGTLLG